jgi:hypothetical protein
LTQRFYLTSNAAAEVSPAFGGAGTWGSTTGALRRALLRHRLAGSENIALGSTISWTAGVTALDRQFVSPRMRAQTISGTVKCQVQSLEVNIADNATSHLTIYVVSADGSTVVGTLLAIGQYGPATELNTAIRNKTYADGDTVSSVTCSAGDRLVVEVGYTDAAGTTPQAQSRWGAQSGLGDLAENETTTGSANPWIEFTTDILFEEMPVTTNRLLEGGFFSLDARTPDIFPVTPNRLLERGFVAQLEGPFVRNEAPNGLSPCADVASDITFTVGTVLPRTLNLSTIVVSVAYGVAPAVIAYDGGGGGFQTGFSGSVTDVSTALEDLRDFVVTPDDPIPDGTVVTVTVEAATDLGVEITPPWSWLFYTCSTQYIGPVGIQSEEAFGTPIVVGEQSMLTVWPNTDTIRGGKRIAITVESIRILDTTQDASFRGRSLPLDWADTSAGGTVTPTLTGAVFSTGGTAGAIAQLANATAYAHFDAAVDVEVLGPRATSDVVDLLILRFTAGIVCEVGIRLGPGGAYAYAFAGNIVGGVAAVDVSRVVTIRFVRNGDYAYAFVGTRDESGDYISLTSLLSALVEPPMDETGTFDLVSQNGAVRSDVRVRASDLTIRSHARIGPRLLENRVDRHQRLVGSVPAATLDEVGTTSIIAFGLFGEAVNPLGFEYTLPPVRTLSKDTGHTLVIVQDPALKDGK